MYASIWRANYFYNKTGLGGNTPLEVNAILKNENTDKAFIRVYGLSPDCAVRALLISLERGRVIYGYWLDPNNNVIRVTLTTRIAMDATFDHFTHFRYVIIPTATVGKNSGGNFKKCPTKKL